MPCRVALLLVLAIPMGLTGLPGCSRFEADDPAGPTAGGDPTGEVGVGVSSQVVVEHPLFEGVSDLLPGDETLTIGWPAASDDVDAAESIVYAVYVVTESGGQDFSDPEFVTAPGTTSVTLGGFPNGTTQHVVVRAIDTDGNADPNEVEWMATPAPVRYVDATSSVPGPDGLSPETAYPTIGQAVGATQTLGGVNLYVAAGHYPENVFLLPGTGLFGSFPPGFDPDARDLAASPTRISTTFEIDLVTIPESDTLVTVDHIVMQGGAVADSGVRASDAWIRVTNCEIQDVDNEGIELVSDFAEGSWIRGLIARSAIVRSGSEGITIDGIPDLRIDNCLIEDCGTEGIESQWVYALAGESARLEITRNRIEGNGDEGIDLDVTRIPVVGPSPVSSRGGEVRLIVQNNEVTGNALQGLQIDIDYTVLDEIDLRARIDDNRFTANGLDGILIDGDAPAYFRVDRCAITGNGGRGVRVSGTRDGPWVRLSHDRILGNREGGVAATDHVGLQLRHSILRGDAVAPISLDRASIDVANCLFLDSAAPITATAIRYSIVDRSVDAAHVGPGVFAADPHLENHPVAISFATADGSGDRVPVANPSAWLPGDTLELRDDGVPRVVEAVLADAVRVTPVPLAPARFGDLVLRSPPGSDVVEREGFLEGSPAIDAGDPGEDDRDGTRADLGPVGGNTPGNVGVETGLPRETTLELVGVTPGAGSLVTRPRWTCDFNLDLEAGFADLLVAEVEGVRRTPSVSIAGNRATVTLLPAPAAGDRVRLQWSPPPAPGPGELTDRTVLDFVAAAPVGDLDPQGGDANGTPATAQLIAPVPTVVSGRIAEPADVDLYRVDLAAGDSLRIELFALRLPSPLMGTLTLLGADGTTVIATASPDPILPEDPVLPALFAETASTVYVRVESADGIGGPEHRYDLAIDVRSPSGGPPALEPNGASKH